MLVAITPKGSLHDQVSANLLKMEAMPHFAAHVWLTFYLCGPPERLMLVAEALASDGWQNTGDWEGAFLDPKVQVEREVQRWWKLRGGGKRCVTATASKCSTLMQTPRQMCGSRNLLRFPCQTASVRFFNATFALRRLASHLGHFAQPRRIRHPRQSEKYGFERGVIPCQSLTFPGSFRPGRGQRWAGQRPAVTGRPFRSGEMLCRPTQSSANTSACSGAVEPIGSWPPAP
jgi:hypothetical protein